MSDEIVRRLRNRSKKDINYLKESMSKFKINEADDDEEDIPDEDLPPMDDEEVAHEEEENEENKDEESEESSAEDDSKIDHKNPNPLDNIYAVNHKIGDEVTIAYTSGTNSELKGYIEGYDKDGFYRVKWEDGRITNGITDIAISDIIGDNKCVCGSTDFIQEGTTIICDVCGRRIRENEDPLTKLDKSRPKGKRMIRSEAHPMSTSVKPSISETIRDIFKKSNTLNEEEDYEDEEDEEEEDSDAFALLKSKLDREFWTRLPELKEDIEDLGYIVEDINAEYVVVASSDDDIEYSLYIPIGGTSRTMTLDFDRSREVR